MFLSQKTELLSRVYVFKKSLKPKEFVGSYPLLSLHAEGDLRDVFNTMYWEWPGLIDLSADHNWENGSFAGKFRCGHLGLDLVRKSATICGVNELVLNCADHVDVSYVDYVKSKIPQYVSIISYGPKAEDRIQL